LGLAGMPRRYADYSDVFFVWNKVSSFGSLLTVLGVLIFFTILCEAFYVKRLIVFINHNRRNLEWSDFRLPSAFHTHNEMPKLVI
jgi:cytochrome c oxidase subunit 1